jgi:hypothetical protein
MKRWLLVVGLALSAVFLSVQLSRAAEATLTWDSNTETDLAKYNIYRGNASGGVCPIGPLQPLMINGSAVSVLKGTGTSMTYVDTTVPVFDGQLCYELTAVDTSNNESTRSTRGVKSVNLVPPQAPRNLQIPSVVP